MQGIRHMVIFCHRAGVGAAETETFLSDGQKTLTQIPGVTEFEVMRQVSAKNDYDFGFSMLFADQAAYEAYNMHPLHVAFVEERWKKEISRFLEIDFRNLVQ